MRHEDAVKTNAVAGYLLHDLTDSEREAFELHFADCEACFDDVRAGANFTTTLREIDPYVEPVPVPEPRPTFWISSVAAASVVLSIAGLAYQQVAVVAPLRAQLTKARQPRITPPPFELHMVRDRQPDLIIDRHSPFPFVFAIVPGVDAPPYTCKIVDAKGVARYTVPITTGEPAEPVDMLIPSEALNPGEYTLIVAGIRGVPVLEKTFTVR